MTIMPVPSDSHTSVAGTVQDNYFKLLWDTGFHDVLPIIPVGAVLSTKSKLKPSALGKIPGRRNMQGTWGGFNWEACTPSERDLTSWHESGAGIGLRCANFPCVDVDVTEPQLAEEISTIVSEVLGPTVIRVGKDPKRAHIYRLAPGTLPIAKMLLVFEAFGVEHRIELLGSGQQIVIHGVHPGTGRPYRWVRNALWEVTPDRLPALCAEDAEQLFERLRTWIQERGFKGLGGERGRLSSRDRSQVDQEELKCWNLDLLERVLAKLPNSDEWFPHRDDYLRVCAAVKGASQDDPERGKAAFVEWAERWDGPHAQPPEEFWDEVKGPYELGWGYLLHLEYITEPRIAAQDEFEALELASACPLPSMYGQAGSILNPTDPYRNAKLWFAQSHVWNGKPILVRYDGDFRRWDKSHWPIEDKEYVRKMAWRLLAEGKKWQKVKKTGKSKGDGGEEPEFELVPFEPGTKHVSELIDALSGIAKIRGNLQPPVWLTDDGTRPPADEILALQNGLLHIPTRQLFECTPDFFTINSLDYSYDLETQCPEWHAFLKSVWENDQESIRTLQEWFGYVLTSDTSQQKILLLIGPRRSGKGTIARILSHLLGRANVASPTLAGLKETFGLQSMIGKLLAVISDARLPTSNTVITERLLSISGEDAQNISRKYKDDWIDKLSARIMMMTNELPAFKDAAGALPGRLIVLRMTTSFFGCEDPQLTARLTEELPGILNWSLDGWARLRERGRFVQPESGKADVQRMYDSASPISAFIRDCCKLGSDKWIAKTELFNAYRDYMTSNGHRHHPTQIGFGMALSAALPELGEGKVPRKQQNGVEQERRENTYVGIDLREEVKREQDDLVARLV